MISNGPAWKQFGYIPEYIAASSMVSQDKEIICASSNNCGVYKFDMDNPNYEWKKFTERNQDNEIMFDSCHTEAALNKAEDKLYTYGSSGTMHIFDLRSNQWKQTSNVLINGDKVIEHCIFSAGGRIHLMGGDWNASHQVWDEQKEQFTVVHTFDEYKFMRYSCCVYLPTKNIVLLLGAMIKSHPTYESMGCVWQYSLVSGVWNKIPGIVFDHYSVSAVLSSDESCVIITPGHSDGAIYVLHINDNDTYTLRQSSIQCPKPGKNHLVRTGGIRDETLVLGYVRRLADVSMPCVALLKTISAFYGRETVHWIEYEGRFGHFADSGAEDKYAHYAIELKKIVLNCS